MTDATGQPDGVRNRVIYTIGHVTLPADRFVALLRQQGITLLVDIRRFPGSRTSPQFNPDDLRQTLANAGIGYDYIGALGGRRQPLADSPNTAWNNASFRGY